MRIVVDLQGAQTESRFRGIGRYCLSFTRALLKNRGDHEVIVALSGMFPDQAEAIEADLSSLVPRENIVTWHVAGPTRVIDEGNSWRREAAEITREAFLLSLNADIIHVMSFFEGHVDDAITSIGRLESNTPVSVHLYDLIPLSDPKKYLSSDPQYNKYYYQKLGQLAHASLFLAISDFTRQEVIRNLGQDEDKVVNVSSAAEPSFRPLPIDEVAIEELRERFKISGPFILNTGGADERKNLPRLIEAFAGLKPAIRAGYQLVIAGKLTEGHYHLLNRQARSVGLDKLVFTGYVSDHDLVRLYNACTLFVFPSEQEGFGLPALEAMCCGAPVISSNTTSVPEVVGFEEALFDPRDVSAIQSKIETYLLDEQRRLDLGQRGLERATLFDWDLSAKRSISAFEALLQARQDTSAQDFSDDDIASEVAAIETVDEPSSFDLLQAAKYIDWNGREALRILLKRSEAHWRIEGPFDSSYSLALLNRETALALDNMGQDVSLHSTEGPGDFDPDPGFLTENQEISRLHARSTDPRSRYKTITSRLLYPPRVQDMSSQLQMLHQYAWEETGFPQDWIQHFNSYLDGIVCMSHHVAKVMIDNGVTVPLTVSGNGVDHWEKIETDSNFKVKAKAFRFLHVSSCFPRKGVDQLLAAYVETFDSGDDVSLVIKTFPNPHNNIREMIRQARQDESCPDIVIIESDLPDSSMKALYEQCDVLVAPSRAEGFGLPLAEAMLSEMPVITTNWSGQTDFCTSESSWLVDYDFEHAETHFDIFLSAWANPRKDSLSAALRSAFDASPEVRREKARKGRQALLADYTWTGVGERLLASADQFLAKRVTDVPVIGWLSSWNTKCGIAIYSEYLVQHLTLSDITVFAPESYELVRPDQSNCKRIWKQGKEANELRQVLAAMDEKGINTLVIQFNYGFFNHAEFSKFVDDCHDRGITILLTMHSTTSPAGVSPKENFDLVYIRDCLQKCDRILVHSVPDLNRLKALDLVDNVALFPLGVLDTPDPETNNIGVAAPIIASYGFCLPHKGLEQLLDAVHILHKGGTPIRLQMTNAEYPAPESRTLVKYLRKKIAEYGLSDIVDFNADFLDDRESLARLSEASLIVYPYQHTGESSSAAVRYGLASGIPVAVSPLGIFSDVGKATFTLPGLEPTEIANGIASILEELRNGTDEALLISQSARDWRKEFSYSAAGSRLSNIMTALLNRLP